MKKLLQIFWTFFKIGAFTFGGGYAMIPLIQREAVEHRKWVTDEDILERQRRLKERKGIKA